MLLWQSVHHFLFDWWLLPSLYFRVVSFRRAPFLRSLTCQFLRLLLFFHIVLVFWQFLYFLVFYSWFQHSLYGLFAISWFFTKFTFVISTFSSSALRRYIFLTVCTLFSVSFAVSSFSLIVCGLFSMSFFLSWRFLNFLFLFHLVVVFCLYYVFCFICGLCFSYTFNMRYFYNELFFHIVYIDNFCIFFICFTLLFSLGSL